MAEPRRTVAYHAALAYRLTDDDIDRLLDTLGETYAEDAAAPPLKTMGRPRRAGKDEALAVIAECEDNVQEAQRRTQIPLTTLHRWLQESRHA